MNTMDKVRMSLPLSALAIMWCSVLTALLPLFCLANRLVEIKRTRIGITNKCVGKSIRRKVL